MILSCVFCTILFASLFAAPGFCAAFPVVAEPSTLDFGYVNEDKGTLELSLQLRNCSATAVKITHVRADCGCTVAKVSQTIVPPNENVEVKVSVRVAGYKGKFNRNINFEIDGEEESVTVPVTGFITSDVWFAGTVIQVFPKKERTVEKIALELHTVDFPNVQFDLNLSNAIFTLHETKRIKDETYTRICFELTVKTDGIMRTQFYRLSIVPADKRIKQLSIPVGVYVASREWRLKDTEIEQNTNYLSSERVNVGLLPRGELKRARVFGDVKELTGLRVEKIENFPDGTIIDLPPFEGTKNLGSQNEMGRCVSITVPESTKVGQIRGSVHFIDSGGNRHAMEILAIVIPN